MIDIKVPAVGESISEVTLVKWLKKEGEYVDRDEVIAELESEKATFEVNAEKAGVLKTVGKEGDTLKIGDVVAQIDESAPRPEGAPAEPVSAPAASANGSHNATAAALWLPFAEAAGAETGSAGAPSGRGADSSICATTSPIFRVSPSFPTVFKTPAFSAFTSKVAFSLSSSAITSSRSTYSPSFFNHFTSVTSLMDSPTAGTLISII